MQTIITDIELNAPEEEFIKWYDYNMRAHIFGFATPNFDSWLNGCPRVMDETFGKLEGMKYALDEAIREEKAKL